MALYLAKTALSMRAKTAPKYGDQNSTKYGAKTAPKYGDQNSTKYSGAKTALKMRAKTALSMGAKTALNMRCQNGPGQSQNGTYCKVT